MYDGTKDSVPKKKKGRKKINWEVERLITAFPKVFMDNRSNVCVAQVSRKPSTPLHETQLPWDCSTVLSCLHEEDSLPRVRAASIHSQSNPKTTRGTATHFTADCVDIRTLTATSIF